MPAEIKYTIYLACGFLFLFATAELIYHAFKPKAEYTRKLVHFGTGIITLLFPVLLTSHWSVLFLCGSFALILLVSLKFNLLKSINAIDRKSHGSISYPISVYACFLFYSCFAADYRIFPGKFIYFYLPILTLAICDPLAALIGRRWPVKKFKVGDGHKSIAGSFSFFVSSVLLSVILYLNSGFNSPGTIFISALLISLLAVFSEAFSPKGLDNLSIPAAVMIGLLISRYFIFNWKFD